MSIKYKKRLDRELKLLKESFNVTVFDITRKSATVDWTPNHGV